MANVSVGNTPGLYIGSGQSRVLTNAQQLLTLLSNNGGVTFALDPAYGNARVEAFSSTFSNANIASYLPTYTGLLGGTLTTASQPNVTAVGTLTSLTATGNITTSNYFIGNGSQLTGIVANYSNVNVAAYLPTYTGNLVSLTGNVTTTANVTGAYILGNGSQLTGLPATYSNANVAAYLPTYTGLLGGTLTTASQPNITAVGTLTGLTSSGNVSAAYFLGNGSLLTGLPATYGNANVAAYLPTYSGLLGGTLTTASQPNITEVGTLTGLTSSGNVSAVYFLGNGSQLTGLPATYSNANVAAYLPTYSGLLGGTLTTAAQPNITSVGTLTSVTTSGNVTAAYANITATVFASNIVTSGSSGNITGANYITANFFVGNGSLLTGISGSGTYGNANVAAFLPTYTGNVGAGNLNIVSTGTVYTPAVQATGSGGGVLKNASGTTQASWGGGSGDNFTVSVSTNLTGANAQVDISPTGTGHVHIKPTGTGSLEIAPTNVGSMNNMTIGNVTPQAANVTTLGASGNVTASYFIGNGSQLTGVTTSLANVAYELQAQSPTPAGNITFDGGGNMILRTTASGGGNATVNIYSGVTVSGANCVTRLDGGATATNLTVGFISSNANVTTTANVQAAYFIGNGSALTGITATASPGGADTQLQYNDAGSLNGNAALTFSKVSGNIRLGNLYVNNGTTNNDVEINTQGPLSTATQSSSAFAGNMVVVGDGARTIGAGILNIANPGLLGAKLLVSETIQKAGNDGLRSSGIGIGHVVNFTSNISSTNTRYLGFTPTPMFGGNVTQTAGGWYSFAGQASTPTAGGGTGAAASVGNVQLIAMSGVLSSPTVNINSTVGNLFGYVTAGIITANSQVGTFIGGVHTMASSGTGTPGNVFLNYNPGTTATYSINHPANLRKADQYYYIYNEDDVSQVRLGSLRRYTEYRANTSATTGTVTVSKTDAQVQYLVPTGNCTIQFANFVPSASDGVNTDWQSDTVTLVIAQGATPYTITMPTGNTAVKYAGNVSTVGNTANAVTMISTTAMTIAGSTTYLVTISPEYI